MGETSGCITISVEISKEKTFMKQIFLFEYGNWDQWSLLSTFLVQNYFAFFYEVDEATGGFEDFLSSEDFLIVEIGESTTYC